MPFELDPKVDLSRAKIVTLDGRALQVAPLTLRSKIRAAVLSRRLAAGEAADEPLDILVDFVLLGLRRTYPGVTRDDLLDSEIGVDELRAAAELVIEQAGGRRPAEGEAPAPETPGPGNVLLPSS